MTRTGNPWDALAGLSTRSPRVLETRERTQRPMTYKPPSMLPDPEPRDGYVFRWVRAASRGVDDKVHFGKRSREGYEPVRAQDHPEVMADVGKADQASGIVEIGGLILCKINAEIVKSRDQYYQDRNSMEMEAADEAYMRDNDPRMRKTVERKSSFGRTLL